MKGKGVSIVIDIFQWIAAKFNGFLFARPSSTRRSDYTHGRLFLWMPIVLGAVAIVPLFSVDGLSMGVVSVFFVSVFVGWLLHSRYIHAIERLLQKQESSRLNDAAFYGKVFPVWTRQISTLRKTGNSAVTELTGLFGEIVSRLGAMLKMSGSSAHTGQDERGFLDAIASSQADIQSVFKDLKTALESVNDSKDLLLAEITMYSANMKDMADEAQKIALQSKIIALNAEIEAARAGESGRAFAAVVAEMRQLSSQSAESSTNMSKKVASIDDAMAKFYGEEKETGDVEAMYVSRAETIINDVVKRFNKITLDMEESIKVMEGESRHIQDDISSALVAMQFQDRVSQIMAHVADNIDALNKLIEVGVHNLDADAWLSEMESKFSIDEEYASLSGEQTSSVNSSSLTYF